VEEGDGRAELEAALARALSDLKLATEARRKLNAMSPAVLEAVRHEREVMERIHELVQRLARSDA
jgi:hypothetical protein